MLTLLVVSILGAGESAAPPALPSAPAAAPTAPALPSAVDLRPKLTEFGLIPRAQGARGTCSIFTTCEAIEFALAMRRGKGVRLSPEFLNWSAGAAIGRPSDGNFFHNALAGFERSGICTESSLPYREKLDLATPPSPESIQEAQLYKQELAGEIAVHWIVPWQAARFGVNPEQLTEIKRVLSKGFPVAAGSGHSRLLVGYQDDAAKPGGGAFITEDSALARFDEVTYEFVVTQVADVFWVETLRPKGSERVVAVSLGPKRALTWDAAPELPQGAVAALTRLGEAVAAQPGEPLSLVASENGRSLLLVSAARESSTGAGRAAQGVTIFPEWQTPELVISEPRSSGAHFLSPAHVLVTVPARRDQPADPSGGSYLVDVRHPETHYRAPDPQEGALRMSESGRWAQVSRRGELRCGRLDPREPELSMVGAEVNGAAGVADARWFNYGTFLVTESEDGELTVYRASDWTPVSTHQGRIAQVGNVSSNGSVTLAPSPPADGVAPAGAAKASASPQTARLLWRP